MDEGKEHPQYPDATQPGLNQNPVGANWQQQLPDSPKPRLWPIALATGILVAIVTVLILVNQ